MIPILLNHIACETDPQQIINNIDAFMKQTPRDIDFRNAKVWVHGVNIPFYNRTNKNWTDETDSRFYWYPGSGFYDVNKHYPSSQYGFSDDNMCWAGSASNALLWFLNTNNDEVQYYLKKHPDIKQTLPSYNFNQVGYDPVFNVFHEYYEDRQAWPTAGFRWFLNGFPSRALIKKRSNISFKGFFNDIFDGKEVFTTSPRQPKKEAFNNFIKESLKMNRAIGFVAYLKNTGNHAMTFWGFEFDEEGNAIYAYEADNNEYNDFDVSFVRRRRITYRNGPEDQAILMNTKYEWPITEVYAVDAQKALWKEYIQKEEGINNNPDEEEKRKQEEEERKRKEEEEERKRKEEEEQRQREEEERRQREEEERKRKEEEEKRKQEEEERKRKEEEEQRQREEEEEEQRQREEEERRQREEEERRQREEEERRQREEEERKNKEEEERRQKEEEEKKKKEEEERKKEEEEKRQREEERMKEEERKKKEEEEERKKKKEEEKRQKEEEEKKKKEEVENKEQGGDTNPSDEDPDKQKEADAKKKTAGKIIGGVGAGVALLAVIIAVVITVKIKKHKNHQSFSSTGDLNAYLC